MLYSTHRYNLYYSHIDEISQTFVDNESELLLFFMWLRVFQMHNNMSPINSRCNPWGISSYSTYDPPGCIVPLQPKRMKTHSSETECNIHMINNCFFDGKEIISCVLLLMTATGAA
jgi:hypothetical protein